MQTATEQVTRAPVVPKGLALLRMPKRLVFDAVCRQAKAEDRRNGVFVDAFGRVDVRPWR